MLLLHIITKIHFLKNPPLQGASPLDPISRENTFPLNIPYLFPPLISNMKPSKKQVANTGMWACQKNYWQNYSQKHFRCISTFSLEEKKILDDELEIMRKYLGNNKLTHKDLIKAKALSPWLLGKEELGLDKRKMDAFEESQQFMRKVLEIYVKTTSNINLIAKGIMTDMLENPDTAVLKEHQWERLLEEMGYFKNSNVACVEKMHKILWIESDDINNKKKKKNDDDNKIQSVKE